MILRIRFGKEGALRFIGHLDVLRTFQKIFRRAGIPMCYSQGFNPHPIMSFALPLGLGLTSEGEYLDAEIEEDADLRDLKARLAAAASEDLPVYGIRILPDDAENAMSTVGRADYLLRMPENVSADAVFAAAAAFMTKKSAVILKQTKTKEAETDIRPMVYELYPENGGLRMKLAAGSAANLKPELLLSAMAEGYFAYAPEGWQIRRMDLMDHDGRSLGAVGEELKA